MEQPWKWFLLLANIAILLLGTVVAVNRDFVCYGSEATIDCSQHLLKCNKGTIFFAMALRGFKRKTDNCSVQSSTCQNDQFCCNYNQHDCFEVYTQEAFSTLAMECWNNKECTSTVPYAWKTICGNDYDDGSGYSYLKFLCLSKSAIRDFRDSNTMTASSLALRYLTSSDTRSYVCLVEAEDCSSRTADVLLAKWPNTYSSTYCSSLSVNNETWLPCISSIQYATYTLTTPFLVWLAVYNNGVSQAWAVIHATDSSTLQVKCKRWTSSVSFPQCSSPPTSPKTDPPTRPGTSMPSEFASSHSTGSSDTSAADVTSPFTSSVASGSSPDVTEGTMPQSADNTGSTAAVVGGVVGAMLVVLLVVALVVTLVFLRRRNPTGKTSKFVTWIKGGNSSNPTNGNSPADKTSESGRAVPHVTPAQRTSLPAYDNSMAAITDEAGSDYNHLHQKPTASTSRDVTYGHLADSNDVTDYGYDHVTKGKPAVRSGDVINNVYDTAGPATGAPSDEDFYNVAGAAKNWPDVINNVYNTSSPATEASSDGDYYNVTGLPETGRDVTDSVYDTPKTAAVPGPGETEACDVTGVDAGSPYEFARDMK